MCSGAVETVVAVKTVMCSCMVKTGCCAKSGKTYCCADDPGATAAVCSVAVKTGCCAVTTGARSVQSGCRGGGAGHDCGCCTAGCEVKTWLN